MNLDLDIPPHQQEAHDFLHRKLYHSMQEQGALSFSDFMETVLYTPHYGYYTSNHAIFGKTGDFVTAPNISPLFGASLVTQILEVLENVGVYHILEFGAGNGDLALSILSEFHRRGLSVHYHILEVSANLQARQQEKLTPYLTSVQWLSALPETFKGCMIANEVLDAMPVTLVENTPGGWMERKVVYTDDEWRFTLSPLSPLAPTHSPYLPPSNTLPVGYQTEISPIASHWVAAISQVLSEGGILLIDYGFPGHEYFHPDRSEGTLMCHFRQKSHSNPFFILGGQDITAHVNFTQIAESAYAQGADILGYTNQANFLMNCGILSLLEKELEQAPQHKLQWMSQLNYLLSEAEMGELFKVLFIGKSLDIPLVGFHQGDRTHTL